MPIDRPRASAHLKAFDFAKLFIEELGWDRPTSRQNEIVEWNGQRFSLTPVAEKRGVRILHCPEIPDRNLRQRIEREITKRVYEHLIIFTDPERTRQVWQWVAREKGKPAAFREHSWHAASSPEPLIQKLDHIAFALDEEEGLTLAGTTLRMRDAFDVEKVTKRFYEAFQQQHQRFLGFIEGLTKEADREWYASLMLNRLMFVYFIQKKRFLDGNIDYLKSRLAQVRASQGADKFHSFYRAFLLKLFHGGLATPKNERDAATIQLLGNIPYLNGGLFEPHTLEADGNSIEIADAAFEGIFEFFDEYEWTLDTRPAEHAARSEINPDVLGHIFEKYINQKQMGAYYTKEDVTDYITKNTVVPWLFRHAMQHDTVAFEPGGAVWRTIADNPDAYIYPAVRKGSQLELPDDINFNGVASPDFGLPTETWREVVARRERYQALKEKLAAGEVTSIEDFVTCNLDIRQFARDVIQYAESPDLVRAFWKGIKSATVLDPACGSGAFLFAALNVLYDLYDACLERMDQFVATAPEGSGPRQVFSDFRDVLRQIAHHPNRDYFIYKSIILDNIFGVDLMDEAVEICKLRLFLKLAAQLQSADRIEPLPDIDFNIRAGNTLVGYTSFVDVRRATEANGFDFDNRAGKIEAAAEDLNAAFQLFRQQQTQLNGCIESSHKADLRARLSALDAQLDVYLAQDYGIEPSADLANNARFAAWKSRHKPFHWLVEFNGIMARGGFDVVIGNPPYVKASEARKDYSIRLYESEQCSDIYAWVMERATTLLSERGAYGMIVPLSLTFSGNFQPLRDFLLREFHANWFSSFARIPAALFSAEVRVRNTIHLGLRSGRSGHHTTITHRWFEQARPHLMSCIEYASFDPSAWDGLIPKLSRQPLLSAFEGAKRKESTLDAQLSSGPTAYALYFKKSAYNWVSFSYEEAPSFDASGAPTPQTKVGQIYCFDDNARALIHTFLNGKIAFIWWSALGDDFDVTKKDFEFLPFPKRLSEQDAYRLRELSVDLDAKMRENVVYKLNAGKRVGNFNLARCRSITDQSDAIWAAALGMAQAFDDLELSYAKIVKTSFDEDEGSV